VDLGYAFRASLNTQARSGRFFAACKIPPAWHHTCGLTKDQPPHGPRRCLALYSAFDRTSIKRAGEPVRLLRVPKGGCPSGCANGKPDAMGYGSENACGDGKGRGAIEGVGKYAWPSGPLRHRYSASQVRILLRCGSDIQRAGHDFSRRAVFGTSKTRVRRCMAKDRFTR